MERGEAEAIYEQGREAAVSVLLAHATHRIEFRQYGARGPDAVDRDEPTTCLGRLRGRLDRATDLPDDARRVLANGRQPLGCDPRAALAPATIRTTAWWRWRFAPAVDYLVCATIADAD